VQLQDHALFILQLHAAGTGRERAAGTDHAIGALHIARAAEILLRCAVIFPGRMPGAMDRRRTIYRPVDLASVLHSRKSSVITLVRTKITYSELRRICLAEIRQWPGCETVAGLRLLRNASPSGFSITITLYGVADKKTADRAEACVERVNGRRYQLSE
jgi:hypothetical protein